jgi:hypothetical protein
MGFLDTSLFVFFVYFLSLSLFCSLFLGFCLHLYFRRTMCEQNKMKNLQNLSLVSEINLRYYELTLLIRLSLLCVTNDFATFLLWGVQSWHMSLYNILRQNSFSTVTIYLHNLVVSSLNVFHFSSFCFPFEGSES